MPVNRRRALLAGASACLAAPFCAHAAAPRYRIGYLHPGDRDEPARALPSFKAGLAELGYVEGRNVAFEERFAGGTLERMPALAAELVALRVDVIAAVSPSAIRAARSATRTIPIVMDFSGEDPVKSGFVASFARPGGNVTGMTSITNGLAPKWVELLREAVPGMQRIAVLRSPLRPDQAEQVDIMRASPAAQGVDLRVYPVREPREYAPAFDAMKRDGAQGVVILSGPEFTPHLAVLSRLAVSRGLASVWQFREFIAAGGLMSYGPSIADLSARAARFVDKILRGAKPGDLPVQRPTRFVLAINLATASVLGVQIPRALALRADELLG
jgi:putative ABC transport system substrate-binding protein